MRKIFSGNHEVIIGSRNEIAFWKEFARKKEIPYLKLFEDPFKENDLENLEALLASNLKPMSVFYCGEPDSDFEKTFCSQYSIIEAAGGVVTNKKGEILMMYRKGKWDLPKGKIDEGESIKAAARREITEETGVDRLKIIKPIKFLDKKQVCSYHTYVLNGKRILKSTYWFLMSSNFKGKLIPQSIEGITEVGWYSKKEVEERLTDSYGLVSWVLNESGVVKH